MTLAFSSFSRHGPPLPATADEAIVHKHRMTSGTELERAEAARIVVDYKRRYRKLWANVRQYERWKSAVLGPAGARRYYEAIVGAVHYLESITDPRIFLELNRTTYGIRNLVRQRIGEEVGTVNVLLDGIVWW